MTLTPVTTCPQPWWRSLLQSWTRKSVTHTHTLSCHNSPVYNQLACVFLSTSLKLSSSAPLQDDDDGHLLALQIIRDLVDKGGDVFLDQLARLGVINKVSTLAGPTSDDENEEESKPEKVHTHTHTRPLPALYSCPLLLL